MDVQPGIVDRVPDKDAFLKNMMQAVEHAHAQNMQVIFVVVGFRDGFPEISARNKSFSTMNEAMRTPFINPQPSIAPAEKDIVVTKKRVSAFSGSDLDVILRAKGIDHLILTGIATSGVVLSTLREAADKDYCLTVLSDLCFDGDAEVHSVLLNKVFQRQANVMTSGEWMK